MKKIPLTVFLCVFNALLFGQNEASYWYFGQNAGLRFDIENGTVTAITDGQINTSEGCTSIANSDGDLMFYTDGRTVWNRNHQIMSNGNYFGSTGLLGDPSSTSSGLIVPKPEDPSKYYIFTVDEPHHENAAYYPNQFDGVIYESGGGSVPNADDGFNNGLNYSLVDMNLNDGLGNVDASEKNIHLVTYDPSDELHIRYKCSEKITAVRAEDCSSFWVITHFGDTFYAFKIDKTGVSAKPVTSTVGPYISIDGYRRNALGYLKASPDASRLISANFGESQSSLADAGGGIYLFDFNNETGIISNSLELYSPQNNHSPYGVEFSAENKKVYATIGLDVSGNGNSQVLQWDLESANIEQSMQVVHSSNNTFPGALQLGIDRKIYRAQFNLGGGSSGRYLGVINNPEADGVLANYDEFGILLDVNGFSQNTGRLGLPPFIQSLFNSQTDIIRNGESTSELKLCTGDTYTLQAEDIDGADYIWSFNGTLLSETSAQLFIDTAGFYEVYIEPNNGDCPIEGSAVVGVFDIPTANSTSIAQCDEDGIPDGITFFNINEIFEDITSGVPNREIVYFLSLPDAENGENAIDGNAFQNFENPQTIVAKVINTNTGCFNFAEITLEVSSASTNNTRLERCDADGTEDGFTSFNLTEANDVVLGGLPSNLDIVYFETYTDALLESNPLPLNFTNTTANNQTIFARVENTNACFGISSIQLEVLPLPNVETTQEIFYCLNSFPETIELSGGVIDDLPNNYYYQWSTGENTSTIQVDTPGDYTVRVLNTKGCFKDRNITVLPSNVAKIIDINIIDASENNTITILVTGEGVYEYALSPNGPFQDSNGFQNLRPGLYTVFVRDKNECGVTEVVVSVIGFPKYFTPNGDAINDYWQVFGISPKFQTNSIIFIFDRFGNLLKELNPLSPGWDGTFNGTKMPSSDYWFKVTLEDGRVFTSHFSLKR